VTARDLPPPGKPRYRHRVLVVDDFPDATQAMCMLFTQMGHSCRQATTGQAALDEASAFLPDIVLLDIGLPDLSGYEVARALRQQRGREVYIAALTGWGQPEDRARAIGAGFDQHILKPATAQILSEIIVTAERSRDELGIAPPDATR
jgi:DNA-binding response OmpR family regulator